MSTNEFWLFHGSQANKSIGSFAAYDPVVLPDGTVLVKLSVEADGEYKYRLNPGDTFSVGDQIWRLNHVENPDKPDWEVQLVRVS